LNDESSPKLLLFFCFDKIKINREDFVYDDSEKNVSMLRIDKIIYKFCGLNIRRKENCLIMMKKENIDELIYNIESEKEGGMVYEMSLILLMKIIIENKRGKKRN
jgi:hypothetical protein